MDLSIPDGDEIDDDAADPYAADAPLAQAYAMLQRMGLSLPPMPEPLLPLLQQVGETVFTTEIGTTSLANRAALVARASRGTAVPGIGLSHEGRGSNTWALHYHAVLPRMALYVDIPFGGAYMDLEASQLEVEIAWASAERLIRAALSAQVDATVVVEHRGVRGSRWCVAGPEPEWRDALNAIDAAAEALEATA